MTLPEKATNEARQLFESYYIDLESEIHDSVTNDKIMSIALDQSIKAVDITLKALNGLFEDGFDIEWDEIYYWKLVKDHLNKIGVGFYNK